MRTMFSRPFWLLILFLLLPLSLAQMPKTTSAQPNYLTQEQLDKELSRQKEIQDLKLQNLENKLTQLDTILTQKAENAEKLSQERKSYLDTLVNQINFDIAWITLLVGIFGVALPVFLTRQLRHQLEMDRKEIADFKKQVAADMQESKLNRETSTQQLEEIRKLKLEIETLKGEVERVATESKTHLEGIRDTHSQAEEALAKLQQNLQPGEKATPEQQQSIKELTKAPEERVRLSALAYQAEQAEDWQAALKHWTSLTDLDATNHIAWFGAAYATGKLADLSQENDVKKRLYLEEISKYQEAIKHKPDMHEARYNWGNTLSELADLSQDIKEKKRLRLEEISKYQEAIKHKPDMHQAWYNWGNALSELADLSQDIEEKKRLRLEEISKYQEAIKHKPDKHQAWSNWGVALSRLADLSQENEEKKRLRLEEISKYQEAIKHKPDDHEAWNNWSISLRQLADLSQDNPEDKQVLQEEESKYRAARKRYGLE